MFLQELCLFGSFLKVMERLNEKEMLVRWLKNCYNRTITPFGVGAAGAACRIRAVFLRNEPRVDPARREVKQK